MSLILEMRTVDYVWGHLNRDIVVVLKHVCKFLDILSIKR